MRVVQPIYKDTFCGCGPDRIGFTLDKWGLTGMFCTVHGDLNPIDKLEFESQEAWQKWKDENDQQEASS